MKRLPPNSTCRPLAEDHAQSFPAVCAWDPHTTTDRLLDQAIIHPEEWGSLPIESRGHIECAKDLDALLSGLLELKLINNYQADRIRAGTLHGLVLGNYRVLGRIGSGGIGVVFEAEHVLMRRKVAIKVLPVHSTEEPDLTARFLREMRSVAQLDHPNIIAAFDAGISTRTQPGEPDLYYFVTELLTGHDLEQYIPIHPVSVATACTIIYQVADALNEAHRHLLIHRDIKPSNIFITEAEHAKLLDFGLVRHLRSNALTTPDLILGTLEYMAPEQAFDPSRVDIRTDIFGLGATLFFALTGANALPVTGTLAESIERRKTQRPLSARSIRSEIPEELENLLNRMMAIRPEDRLATPQAVMHALLPFLDREARGSSSLSFTTPNERQAWSSGLVATNLPTVLVVNHDATVRRQLVRPLMSNGLDCSEAPDAEGALRVLRSQSMEAVLLAADLPDTNESVLLRTLRDNPPCANLKIIMTVAEHSANEMTALLSTEADDFFCLPITDIQLVARVKAAVKHKQALDRMDRLSRQLLDLNMELEQSLKSRSSDLVQARNALVLALARLVEYRSTETIAHLFRIQRYCGILAQEAIAHPHFAAVIDLDFVQTVECCAPLHDIGNVGLPDHVLLKAGRLDADERKIMQTHTLIGAETLQHVARRFGAGVGFLNVAIDIARNHHEHFDGSGYPDGLASRDIPLAARIVAIADAYDSLRSRRAQRPGLSHNSALEIMFVSSPGKFDPLLLGGLNHCGARFDRVFREVPDSIPLD